MRSPTRCLGLLAILALLAGCAAFLERPRVNIANVTLKEVRLFEQIYALELRVQNPNDSSLVIQAVTFDLEVNDRSFARGLSNQAVTIERFGTGLISLEAVSPLTSLLRQIAGAQKDGLSKVRYRLRGAIHLGDLGFKLPFDESGEIALPASKTP
ncbi:MAG: LEA type 2 family protein [Candidatus Methylomirabilota bacterium]